MIYISYIIDLYHFVFDVRFNTGYGTGFTFSKQPVVLKFPIGEECLRAELIAVTGDERINLFR